MINSVSRQLKTVFTDKSGMSVLHVELNSLQHGSQVAATLNISFDSNQGSLQCH